MHETLSIRTRRPHRFPLAGALLAVLAAAPAVAQEADTHASPLRAPDVTPTVLLPGERLGVGDPGRALGFRLEELDRAALLAEEATLPRFPQRVGVPTAIGVSVDAEREGWIDVRGGRLWYASFTSPGAFGMRLALEGLDLAPGAEVYLASGAGPTYATQGPIAGRGPNGTGALWSQDFTGDTVYVQYWVPDGVEARSFAIPAAQHLYRDVVEMTQADPEEQSSFLGNCQQDVLCFPVWHPLKEATVRYTLVDGGTFLCSATLLATTAQDETPYLMTANHCVSNQSVASTISARWFYQTNSCNGSNAAYQTTNGATFLMTSGGADMTLLLIEDALPSGVTWAGWTSSFIANGTAVGLIHHPGGARKKYSDASVVNHTFGDPTHYYGVSVSLGTIEGGSSGSGMYRASDQRFIGVCSHGPQNSTCNTNPDGPFGYGKLSWWYNASGTLQSYLAAGSDDFFEPNDTCATAASLGAGSYPNLVVKRLFPDWYAITIDPCIAVDVTLSHENDDGDVDLRLYDGCGGGGILIDQALGTNDLKSVSAENTGGSPITVWLQVSMGADDADTRNKYNLTLSLSAASSCNGCATPLTFCSSAPNSIGGGAFIGYQGTSSIGTNAFTLTATGLPPLVSGIFFYGYGQTFLPFWDGWRCVADGGVGTFRLDPLSANFLGEASYAWDLTTAPLPAGLPVAGAMVYTQLWYRDPAAGGTGANLTDGLIVTFCP